ncbi:hypothetical protein Hanom_Chr13g01220351 [Helianthus anomalus]
MIATEGLPSPYSFISFHAVISCTPRLSCMAYVTRLMRVVRPRDFVKAIPLTKSVTPIIAPSLPSPKSRSNEHGHSGPMNQ